MQSLSGFIPLPFAAFPVLHFLRPLTLLSSNWPSGLSQCSSHRFLKAFSILLNQFPFLHPSLPSAIIPIPIISFVFLLLSFYFPVSTVVPILLRYFYRRGNMPPSATPRYATGRHRYKPILSMEIIPIFFTSQARKLTVYFLFG